MPMFGSSTFSSVSVVGLSASFAISAMPMLISCLCLGLPPLSAVSVSGSFAFPAVSAVSPSVSFATSALPVSGPFTFSAVFVIGLFASSAVSTCPFYACFSIG